MADEELDDLEKLEGKAPRAIPTGWRVLFFGLVAWGAWYLWAYSPWGSGWSQAKDLEGATPTGVNVLWTVAFTAIPAVAALLIFLAQRQRKGG